MGHIQDMTASQRLEFLKISYEQKRQENKGHNYEYWSDEKHGSKIESGWQMYLFDKGNYEATRCETIAVEAVTKLRKAGHHARILCGYIKTKQHTRHFSILYKKKKTSLNKTIRNQL